MKHLPCHISCFFIKTFSFRSQGETVHDFFSIQTIICYRGNSTKALELYLTKIHFFCKRLLNIY